MGQAEVIKFLQKVDKPLTKKEIAQGMGENEIKVSHILSILVKWSEIEFEEYSSDQIKRMRGYSPGRRTRVYFVKKEIHRS